MNRTICSRILLGLLLSALTAACVEPPTVVVQPLRVINWAPASGTVCVDVAAEVYVTFSDDILTETLTDESLVLLAAAGPISATQTYDKTSFTARLSPATALDYGTVYTVRATTDVAGGDQGPLPVELESSFQTVGRNGCAPGAECQLASDCPGTEVCSSIGVCIAQCVTNRDCPTGTACASGSCN